MHRPGAPRWYRALLWLLPARFRQDYGDALAEQFEYEWDEACRQGRRMAVAVRATLDVVRLAPRQHWRDAGQPSQEEAMLNFIADFRYAIRSFSRQRGATSMVLLTLTLAVAANTGVFVLLDGLFLRPVPLHQPSRLVYLNEQAPSWNLPFTGINYPDFVSWQQHTSSFTHLAAFDAGSFNVVLGDTPERITGAAVSWEFPAVIDVSPELGRFFRPEEDRPGGPNVVVLGHDLWLTRMGGAKDVIGRTLRIDSRAYTIIGVAPRAASFPGDVKLWTPLAGDPHQSYQNYSLEGIGRLKPGVTLAAANVDLRHAEEPAWRDHDTARVVSPKLMPLRDWVIGESRSTGQVLGIGAVLVLLIACANVGGAMLARSTFRRREIAIRTALGASGSRLSRQLLTESLVLASAAGILGTAIGWLAVRALMLNSADRPPNWAQLQFTPRVMVFGVLLITVVTVLFGLGPALQTRRLGIRDAIGGGQRTGTGAGQRSALNVLVVVEIALASMVLIAGGLLGRAFLNLSRIDPGFQPAGVTEFRVSLPDVRYHTGPQQRQFYEQALQRISAIPGVSSAGAITCLPFTCHWGNFYFAEGSALKPGGDNPVILSRIASPDYFRTMGIRFVAGRPYTSSEERPMGELFPVVINEEFAHLHWPGTVDPIGKRISFRGPKTNTWMTVVGVVHDVRHYGLATPMRPGIYMPMSLLDTTQSWQNFGFAVKSSDNPAAAMAAVRVAMHQLDPEIPLFQMRSLQNALDASMAARKTLMLVLASFACIALVLSIGGIYAVLSYVVGDRRREIGIRMALGAQQGRVLGMVVRQGLLLVMVGLMIGLPVSLLGSRVLASLLVGIKSTDLATYAAVGLLLCLTGILATIAPARRAASVDPRTVLSE